MQGGHETSSVLHMHHLLVALIEFADADTAQKMHHRADIDNHLIIGASL